MSWNQEDRMPIAWSLFHQDKVAEAEAIAKSIVDWQPQNLQAIMMMGYAAARQSRPHDAEKWFRKANSITPTAFEPLNWLASILCQLGKFQEAKTFAGRAIKEEPKNGDAHNNLGLALMGLGEYKAATESFLDALHVEAPGPETLYNLGLAFFRAEDHGEAARAFEFHLQRNPGDALGWLRLAETYNKLGDLGKSLLSAQKAAELSPNDTENQLAAGWAWVSYGRAENGKAHLEKALQIDPANAQAIAKMGACLQTLGQFNEARQWLERAIGEDDAYALAYYHLFNNEKVGADLMPYVVKAEALMDSDRLSPSDKSLIGYGLGKAFDNLKDYERAMSYFDATNQILLEQRSHAHSFDRDAFAKTIDRMMELYDRASRRSAEMKVTDSDVPVFIFGMMRSGTTLLEQILSSHPEVAPGGEIGFTVGHFPNEDEAIPAYKHAGAEYFAKLMAFGPSSRITDKAPTNYLAAGPISLLFPNARLIETTRHPVDVCISNWTIFQRSNATFVHRKSDLVFVYRHYERLMRHWRASIPANHLMQVKYEDVVQDREPVLRKTVEFIGLGWSEALLSHEENKRTVATPSLWQVRQPIYTSSQDRWKNYEPWLGEFADLLSPSALGD